jgi:hypothetical protein|nr:hypothetical protein [Candidatus Krumholzibacteria bacterium]
MKTFSPLLLILSSVACLLVAHLLPGCGDDPGEPSDPTTNPLVGYWGLVYSSIDGGQEYEGDGSDNYWVIYSGGTVCLIEQLPSGDYQKDSTFIYDRDGDVFTARFDLDPVPMPQPALPMTYRHSANSDTLFFAWEEVDTWSAGQMTMVRQDSIPACGCDTIP